VKLRDERGRVYDVGEGDIPSHEAFGRWFRAGRHRFALYREKGRVYLFYRGMLKVFERALEGKDEEESGTTASPITGRITSVKVKEGDRVRKGQPIMTIESMKMETVIEAPHDGTIIRIYRFEGDLVNQGEKLFEIEE